MKYIIQKKFDKLKLKNPILIEGLPGIGNVGKIAVDFIIDELEPELLYEIYSYAFPHSVFISDDDLIELPSMKIYLYKQKERDILFFTGDVQPTSEETCYELSDKILDLVSELDCKEIITLGGIGREGPVKNPKVFGTATTKKIKEKYKKLVASVNFKISGCVANIFGMSGVLLGLAKLRNMGGASFLVDTVGHPMHLGLSESKELVRELDHIFKFKIDIKKLEDEVKESEKQIKSLKQNERQKQLDKLKKMYGEHTGDTSYIG